MSNELVVQDQAGVQLFRQSTDAAGMCKEIVLRTAKNIQGRKFVPVEGWQAIAIAHGCVASAGDVQRTDTGFRAIAWIKRADTGQMISTAEGFVGDDEPLWAKRAEYAKRAMAQTRAISRACRSAFAHVVVMMNAGLSTTPAEEMDFEDKPAKTRPASQVPPEPTPSLSSSANAGGAISPRAATFKHLCEQAKVNMIDVLAKAGVAHADEMSNQDWTDCQAMLNRKITKRAKDFAGQA